MERHAGPEELSSILDRFEHRRDDPPGRSADAEMNSADAGGTAVGRRKRNRIRALEGLTTSLGPPQAWPQSLRSAASICWDSPFPICVYWGPDHLLLYNEAWSPIPGDKHPWALSKPAREVWPEIWHIIGPEFEGVFKRGEGVWSEDRLLPMQRHGYVEAHLPSFASTTE